MCIVPTLQALAKAFQVNKSVTQVDLGGNKFGDEGLKARAGAVEQWDLEGRRLQCSRGVVQRMMCLEHF